MKTALITGGSAGIGKETARHLASQGYEVLIAARDAVKGQAFIEELKRDIPQARAEFHAVNLADFDQVRALCRQLRAERRSLNLLILNAGLFTPKLRTGPSGHEFMFATTHLGHFLMTHELLPLLKAGSEPRIVVTSSVAHNFAARNFDFESLRSPSPRSLLMLIPFRAYGRSKLANILFVRELARRLDGSGIQVNAFHPGSIKSEIWRSTPGLFNLVIDPFLVSTRKGAETQIHLATAPALVSNGDYWFNRRPERSSRASRDPQLAAQLWRYSIDALGIVSFGMPG